MGGWSLVNGCTLDQNTDYQGNDLKPLQSPHVANVTACCDLCSATPGCAAFTFMPNGVCYKKANANGKRTFSGYTSGTCAPAPPAPAPAGIYRCDAGEGERGVCIQGTGPYKDSTCDGKCGTPAPECKADWDCSLAGVCDTTSGKCSCDPWASGSDCSYLNFEPVDLNQLGYLDPLQSSWGGNAVYGKDELWHLYMAEIACAQGSTEKRCGLGGWGSNSQVAHAVSQSPAGPYKRQELVLPREHHNPTLKVSPVDGSWNLYSIKATSGPIVMSSSSDQGRSWTSAIPGVQVSQYQNPGPMLNKNGSMTMWYRDAANLAQPRCSTESIGVQYCASKNATCQGGHDPVFQHTAEDPSVFVDHRGNWHMLVNAFPGGCNPKLQQGGHAWSKDGVVWSEPRAGAYNTTFVTTDNQTITCGRRERPQIITDPITGKPLVMTAGVTGCPSEPFREMVPWFGKHASDCFTLAQKLVQ